MTEENNIDGPCYTCFSCQNVETYNKRAEFSGLNENEFKQSWMFVPCDAYNPVCAFQVKL